MRWQKPRVLSLYPLATPGLLDRQVPLLVSPRFNSWGRFGSCTFSRVSVAIEVDTYTTRRKDTALAQAATRQPRATADADQRRKQALQPAGSNVSSQEGGLGHEMCASTPCCTSNRVPQIQTHEYISPSLCREFAHLHRSTLAR